MRAKHRRLTPPHPAPLSKDDVRNIESGRVPVPHYGERKGDESGEGHVRCLLLVALLAFWALSPSHPLRFPNAHSSAPVWPS
jgi:hypothetical protein